MKKSLIRALKKSLIQGVKNADAAGARAHRPGLALQGASALSIYGKDTHTLTAEKSRPAGSIWGSLDYMGAQGRLASSRNRYVAQIGHSRG